METTHFHEEFEKKRNPRHFSFLDCTQVTALLTCSDKGAIIQYLALLLSFRFLFLEIQLHLTSFSTLLSLNLSDVSFSQTGVLNDFVGEPVGDDVISLKNDKIA